MKKQLFSLSKGRGKEELPVPAGIIPHFLLKKRKKKEASLFNGPAQEKNIH
ncbi:hypothetical protein [Melghirimyces algeriensis]|uniref:Uncharacterized protein n=1 Tax=Melghirimyces algeriensis TaxID=910412 RepID=A0A521DN49_9BACL|nr:hypothetical protein [Melghirimyces algeriensis]SMO73157.1 hypothetical protein SAMN06264849_106140 [Melghirimyces algeriensis]